MKFIYPAILTPMEDGSFEAVVPDLEGCRVSGFNLNDCMEEANHAVLEWITLELEEDGVLPPVSEHEDLPLEEGQFVRNVCVTYRAYDGWDE